MEKFRRIKAKTIISYRRGSRILKSTFVILIKTITFCVLYALLNTGGAAVIKYHLKGSTLVYWRDWVGFLIQPFVIFAFAVIFLSALVMFKALSSGAFSLVIPIATGINFIFTVVIGYFLFNDTLDLRSLIGFVLILLGVLVLSSNSFSK